MIDYLVPSLARRSLLKLLWVMRLKASASTLAHRAELSFSTAYAELKAMENAGLAQSEYEGNRHLFCANPEYPHARLLREILRIDPNLDTRSNSVVNDRNHVLASLVSLGAPLGTPIGHLTPLPLEETLAKALKLARTNATVARVLPIVLHRNKARLNFEKLKSLASKVAEKRTLGFFLELTALLSRDKGLKTIALTLQDKRMRRHEHFFRIQHQGHYARVLEKRNTPAIAKKWKFTMNMRLDSFEDLFHKFVDIEAPPNETI